MLGISIKINWLVLVYYLEVFFNDDTFAVFELFNGNGTVINCFVHCQIRYSFESLLRLLQKAFPQNGYNWDNNLIPLSWFQRNWWVRAKRKSPLLTSNGISKTSKPLKVRTPVIQASWLSETRYLKENSTRGVAFAVAIFWCLCQKHSRSFSIFLSKGMLGTFFEGPIATASVLTRVTETRFLQPLATNLTKVYTPTSNSSSYFGRSQPGRKYKTSQERHKQNCLQSFPLALCQFRGETLWVLYVWKDDVMRGRKLLRFCLKSWYCLSKNCNIRSKAYFLFKNGQCVRTINSFFKNCVISCRIYVFKTLSLVA